MIYYRRIALAAAMIGGVSLPALAQNLAAQPPATASAASPSEAMTPANPAPAPAAGKSAPTTDTTVPVAGAPTDQVAPPAATDATTKIAPPTTPKAHKRTHHHVHHVRAVKAAPKPSDSTAPSGAH